MLLNFRWKENMNNIWWKNKNANNAHSKTSNNLTSYVNRIVYVCVWGQRSGINILKWRWWKKKTTTTTTASSKMALSTSEFHTVGVCMVFYWECDLPFPLHCIDQMLCKIKKNVAIEDFCNVEFNKWNIQNEK